LPSLGIGETNMFVVKKGTQRISYQL